MVIVLIFKHKFRKSVKILYTSLWMGIIVITTMGKG